MRDINRAKTWYRKSTKGWWDMKEAIQQTYFAAGKPSEMNGIIKKIDDLETEFENVANKVFGTELGKV